MHVCVYSNYIHTSYIQYILDWSCRYANRSTAHERRFLADTQSSVPWATHSPALSLKRQIVQSNE